MIPSKNIHTVVLDAGPLLKNDPSISSLLSQSEVVCTVPSVITEIRDASARSRVETTFLPFLIQRNPNATSLKIVTAFSRRTGDYEVLSKADLLVVALAYELECERNGGDWRLRKVPGQKQVNGAPPVQETDPRKSQDQSSPDLQSQTTLSNLHCTEDVNNTLAATKDVVDTKSPSISDEVERGLQDPTINETKETHSDLEQNPTSAGDVESEDSDSEGWITPSNIKKHQAKDQNTTSTPAVEPKTMQVATITSDFAMQNVLLQMNLNLLSPGMQRIRHLKTYILRCHACFQLTKDMSKQFCPRCGKPTLTRVACTTGQNGEFKVHLKKNIQWNTRGDRFSIPKPVSGSASGKLNIGGGGKGGGKGGWGQGLILAEDQKEYVQAISGAGRRKEKDLMDQDYLPDILTGERSRAGGRPKVGGGRNVNSKKRH
jgi:RNA-binding protein NOB1